jgi:hypothetical protein
VAVIGPAKGRRYLEADAATEARPVERIVGAWLCGHGRSTVSGANMHADSQFVMSDEDGAKLPVAAPGSGDDSSRSGEEHSMSLANKEPRTGTFLGVPYDWRRHGFKARLGSAGGTRPSRACSPRGPSVGATPSTWRGCFGAGRKSSALLGGGRMRGGRLGWASVRQCPRDSCWAR